MHGFGVRVYASGRKTFTVRYTLHGQQQRTSIGVYRNERGIVGGEIGFAAARAEAERIISEARNGRDPFVSERLLRKADITTFDGCPASDISRIRRPAVRAAFSARPPGSG